MSRIKPLLPFILLSFPLLLVCIALAIYSEVNGYLIAFGVSCYLLVAALVFYHIDNQHLRQTGLLSDLLDALIDGDYSLRGKDLYSDHFQSLLQRVNRLAQTLQNQTLALREHQLLLQQVIDSMNAAVMAIDKQGAVVFANRAANHLLDLSQNSLQSDLMDYLNHKSSGQSVQIKSQWCVQMHPGGEFLLQKDLFISQGQPNQLMVLSEVGQLLHHNEAAAWQRLVRVISHEINNSMAPINTISRTMLKQAQTHQLSDKVVEGLHVIQQRCEHMMGFIASYSKVSQLPAPNKTLVSLRSLLQSPLGLFKHRAIEIHGDIDRQLYCDHSQIQQVLINLLKNADEASQDPDSAISISLTFQPQQMQIDIVDCGVGINNNDNLFVPFYSTKQGGSGVGLMLSQQIIQNHGGSLSLTNRQGEPGAIAQIILPYTDTMV